MQNELPDSWIHDCIFQFQFLHLKNNETFRFHNVLTLVAVNGCKMFVDCGSFDKMVDLLTLNSTTCDIQFHGCKVMAALAMSESTQSMCYFSFFILLDIFSFSQITHLTFYLILFLDGFHKKRSSEVLSLIHNAMRNFPGKLDLQIVCCGALCYLTEEQGTK